MQKILAAGVLIFLLVAIGLVYLLTGTTTASSSTSSASTASTASTTADTTEYYSPLEKEVYVSSDERILYVPWHGSLKAFDSFFVSYNSINETHTEVKLVIDGSENSATLGKKLEFTDTEGDKYVAVIEEIRCQYCKVRILSM